MQQSPDGHICWGTEPWFAWDLWNEVPGANDQFQLMLNGGFALAPADVYLTYGDLEYSLVLPTVVEMDPVIGDFLPIYKEHGLWHCWASGQDTIVSYDNEQDADMRAQMQPYVQFAKPVTGGQGHFYRPWNVIPLPDASQDDLHEFDEAHNWLTETVANFSDGDRFSIDGLDAIYVDFTARIDVQRRTWLQALSGMAKSHKCAALMRNELEDLMAFEAAAA